MKFRQLSEKWLDVVKLSVATSTFFGYYEILDRYIYPEFEKISVNRIKQQQITDFYIRIQTKISRATNRPYSSTIINMIHQIIYKIMRFGRDKLNLHCILPEFVKVRKDFESQEPVLFFLDEELGKVIRRLYEIRSRGNLFLKLGILMSLFHGLRIGEVCGLRWEDIDFNNQTMHIRRTASYIYDPFTKEQYIYIRGPKTKKSNRTIHINDSVFEVLKFLKAKNKYSGYLIRNSLNCDVPDAQEPCSDAVLRQKLCRTLKQAGVDSHRFHCLRHTFASHAIACGANPKTVSVVLGHSSVAFTLNVYVHPSEQELSDCVNFWQFNLVKFLHLDDSNETEDEEQYLIEKIPLKKV